MNLLQIDPTTCSFTQHAALPWLGDPRLKSLLQQYSSRELACLKCHCLPFVYSFSKQMEMIHPPPSSGQFKDQRDIIPIRVFGLQLDSTYLLNSNPMATNSGCRARHWTRSARGIGMRKTRPCPGVAHRPREEMAPKQTSIWSKEDLCTQTLCL